MVCTAVVDARDGGDKVPLFVHFFESRASDGTSRNEVLSTIYQGRLFQGKHLNRSADPGTDVPITLRNGKRVRFRGTYTWTTGKLTLEGKLADDPNAISLRDVTAELTCTALSV
jgi:hypothetical protein